MADTLVVNEIYLSLQGESTLAGLPCVFVRLTACNLRCSYCDTAYAFAEGKKRSLADVVGEVRRLAEPFRQPAGDGAVPGRPGSGACTAGGAPGTAPPYRNGVPGTGWPYQPAWPYRLPLVEVTGGEPLLQAGSLSVMRWLCDDGFTVLLETSGALDVAAVDRRVRKIMDLKCPSSGEMGRNRWENLAHLQATDEIKFVIGTREDYDWAKRQIAERGLARLCPLLVSWVHPLAPHQQDPSLKPAPGGQTGICRQELAERILADALPVRFQVQLHKLIWPPDRRGV